MMNQQPPDRLHQRARRVFGAAAALLIATLIFGHAEAQYRADFDLVIYGGTPAAITAALEAADSGAAVAIVCPERHVGGMTANGLGWTDTKDANAIGGLAREFYHRVWLRYHPQQEPSAATRQYDTLRWQAGPVVDPRKTLQWTFEPHVAQSIFDDWLAEKDIVVHSGARLDRDKGVVVRDHTIQSLATLDGKAYRAKMFIDATYEGDLMAAAGVTHRIGRDASSEYGENLNGILLSTEGSERYAEKTYAGVDPYVRPGDPTSGLIAGLAGVASDPFPRGMADRRIQSFNYRLCLTDEPGNRVTIEKPYDYDAAQYELLLRLVEAEQSPPPANAPMPGSKTDTNNSGRMSLDFVGGNYSEAEGWSYGDADYARRRTIDAAHRRYTAGLLWTLQNHPRVPEASRREWSRWGLAKDEFVDNEHWPRQLYVREARRMVGQFVMTQHHVTQTKGFEVPDSIGMGSYSLDSHVVRRVVYQGEIRDEGGFYVMEKRPYPIAYGAILPRRGEVENLLVPVTLSATHAAFGSIRMEPTYMILGQSAAVAAQLAIELSVPVQAVPYEAIESRLLERGQVLRKEHLTQHAAFAD